MGVIALVMTSMRERDHMANEEVTDHRETSLAVFLITQCHENCHLWRSPLASSKDSASPFPKPHLLKVPSPSHCRSRYQAHKDLGD